MVALAPMLASVALFKGGACGDTRVGGAWGGEPGGSCGGGDDGGRGGARGGCAGGAVGGVKRRRSVTSTSEEVQTCGSQVDWVRVWACSSGDEHARDARASGRGVACRFCKGVAGQLHALCLLGCRRCAYQYSTAQAEQASLPRNGTAGPRCAICEPWCKTVTGTAACSAAMAAKSAGLRSVVGSTWMRWGGKGLCVGDGDSVGAQGLGSGL